MGESILVKGLLINGSVFVEVYLFVLELADEFEAEFELCTVAEFCLEIKSCLEVLLDNIFLLLCQFLE